MVCFDAASAIASRFLVAVNDDADGDAVSLLKSFDLVVMVAPEPYISR